MKPPYENNKVYAIARHPKKGLRVGFVAAVYALVRYEESGRVSTSGEFFLVNPDDWKASGGTPDRWDPSITEDAPLALSEDAAPLIDDLEPAHILSSWSDRETAWAAYEARRAAGRKAAVTAAERRAAASAEEQAAQYAAERAEREASPLGRLKESIRGLENAFVVPARNGRPERVFVSLTMSPEAFAKLAERRGGDAALVEEFFAAERADQ